MLLLILNVLNTILGKQLFFKYMEENKTIYWKFRDNNTAIELGDTVYYIAKEFNYSQGERKTKLSVKSCKVFIMSANYINKDKCLKEDICPIFVITDQLYSTGEACQIAINNILDKDFVKDNLDKILDKISSSNIGHLSRMIRDSEIDPFNN